MVTILTYLFYSFAVAAIIFEFFRLSGLNIIKIINDLGEKAKTEAAYNKQIEEAEMGSEFYQKDKKIEDSITMVVAGCTFISFNIIYWIWVLVGLMSSQYILFAGLTVLSILTGFILKRIKDKEVLQTKIIQFDAAVSIALLMFILINRFQLGWF